MEAYTPAWAMVAVMTDQNVDWALEVAARWMTFVIDLALPGDLTQALDQVSSSENDEQANRIALENLFWN